MSDAPPSLPRPCLMLVTDRGLTGGVNGLVAVVAAAVDGGVNAVQVREKDLGDAELTELVRRVVAAASGRAVVLVNDRPAVARAAGADGVHLSEAFRPALSPRSVAGRGLIAGRCVHSLDAALAAAAGGAAYLVLGTIFPSRSHPGGETGGLERVREVVAAVYAPVVGIGGIDATNVGAVIAAGAAGVAVISAILGQADPRAAARRLRRALDEAWQAARSAAPAETAASQ